MKALFYTILNFGWTLLYFLSWGGLVYGPLTGFIVGTTLVPGFGSFSGFLIGIAFGVIAGAMMGVTVALYQMLFFNRSTDLALYRHHLARMVGIGVLLFGLFLLGCDLNGSPHYEKSTSAWFVSLGIGAMIFMWISLTGAYTAYHYPNQMVKRLIWQNPVLDNSPMPLKVQSALSEAEDFLHSIYPRWAHWAAAALGLIGAIIVVLADATARSGAERFMLVGAGAFGSMIVVFFFFAYCAIGSGLLVIFIKQLVLDGFFPDLSQHRVRVTLTLIAFVYTLIMTWWTFIFAPVCALYIAYNVYHTLALPPEGYDKAKRKEKGSTPALP